MLNYNHLRYFWVVARAGHLTRAAEQLNLSQSALSTQIRKLEHQIGHELFERRGRSLVLTEAGQIALDYADGIFSAGAEMLGRLQNATSTAKTILRVGALSTLSRNFQIGFLRPLLSDNSIEVVIRSGAMTDLLTGLEAHRLDILLVNQLPLRDAATAWTARLIDAQEISLIGTPARVAGRDDYRALLASEPMILPTADSGFRNGIDVLLEQLSITPIIAAEVDDMAMLRLLAREDIGIAALPPIVVTDELANGRLVEACKLPGITESFFAVTPQRRFEPPALKALLRANGEDGETVLSENATEASGVS